MDEWKFEYLKNMPSMKSININTLKNKMEIDRFKSLWKQMDGENKKNLEQNEKLQAAHKAKNDLNAAVNHGQNKGAVEQINYKEHIMYQMHVRDQRIFTDLDSKRETPHIIQAVEPSDEEEHKEKEAVEIVYSENRMWITVLGNMDKVEKLTDHLLETKTINRWEVYTENEKSVSIYIWTRIEVYFQHVIGIADTLDIQIVPF